MENRNQPTLKTCPHCGNKAMLMPKLGDYSEYNCPTCGTYRISGTMEKLIKNGADPTAAHFEQQRDHKFLVV
jgi:Zn-finger nucleic acid-binding protein